MKVAEWCEKKKRELGSYRSVAEYLGIASCELSRIKAGRLRSKTGPKLETLILFRDKSGGEVSSVSDWE